MLVAMEQLSITLGILFASVANALLYRLAAGAGDAQWRAALAGHRAQCLCGEQEALYALVMKWEEGGALHDLLHAPGVAWGARTGERLLLCARIASGLRHLHLNSAGEIIHGDLKPENILLSKRGADALPRVSDFGLAKLREVGRTSRVSSIALTQEKRGTWPYMAPEMLLEVEEVGHFRPRAPYKPITVQELAGAQLGAERLS